MYRRDPDLFTHSDRALAKANRIAAETVMIDPNFTYDERVARHALYTAEAERLEALDNERKVT